MHVSTTTTTTTNNNNNNIINNNNNKIECVRKDYVRLKLKFVFFV